MDNILIITGFIALFSVCLVLWDVMAKKLAKRQKAKDHPN